MVEHVVSESSNNLFSVSLEDSLLTTMSTNTNTQGNNADGTIRVAEMFAGIGGFRLGLERANSSRSNQSSQQFRSQRISSDRSGESSQKLISQSAGHFSVVWANEWDKNASQIYRKNFGENELVEGDMRKVNTVNIPDIDMLVGGFPCQPHSLAGKRQGFRDERGEVFYEIVRVAKAKRPKILLLENVKGLLSSEQGRAFGTVLEELGNIGYWCEWQVINSKYHGVPQNRERVFIIGHLRGTSSRQVFPIGEGDAVFGKKQQSEQVCSTITSRYHKRGMHDPYILQERSNNDRTSNSEPVSTPMVVADRTRSYAGLGRSLESPKPICNTLSGVQKDNLILLDNFGGNIKQRVKNDGVAWTLGGSKTGVFQEQSIRRLTEPECELLQGFPKGWTEGISGTQRYKCLGNAVTVNVIQFLGEKILEALR